MFLANQLIFSSKKFSYVGLNTFFYDEVIIFGLEIEQDDVLGVEGVVEVLTMQYLVLSVSKLSRFSVKSILVFSCQRLMVGTYNAKSFAEF
ncbi:hypothetical protein BpHYR1_002248 [Brachionus plicatilis]|uniref:Uncharacterized protein n=1 Tax=Brachionus plicatilis TaxID=10195 RepID=A0A3M7S550_BRAPC|nr:hypothetical protein BpHYR1_002248 [Brachionus plicatilis]